MWFVKSLARLYSVQPEFVRTKSSALSTALVDVDGVED